ncbi:MAG: hypothetical protein HZA70_04880, partial [Planctomycetes bacterium]|nr:hypothetical protein [Planctomycetota bacterium]
MMGSQETKTGILVLDEGFPKRVFNTSLLLVAMIALCSTSFRSFEISYSVLIGCAISLGLC